MIELLEKLKGGDRRSIGRSEEVVQDVLNNPDLFGDLISGMVHDDPVVRMRSADAVEKITASQPELLQNYIELILTKIARVPQPEVRWHVAQILPRLVLNEQETQVAIEILQVYLQDDSRIVRTFSLDTLTYYAENDPTLEPWVIGLIEELVEDGSPAMQSRGRRLLTRLKKDQEGS